MCRIIDNDKVDFSYLIPDDLLHVTVFKIMFIRSDGLGRTDVSVTCLDAHLCSSLYCDVCLDRFANPHCYKFVNWLLLILIISGFILVIPVGCLTYKLITIILAIFLIPAKVITRIIIALVRKCKRTSTNMAQRTSMRLNQLVNEENEVQNARQFTIEVQNARQFRLVLHQ